MTAENLTLMVEALAAVITLGAAAFVARQTFRHFSLQRASHFIERFNSERMNNLRHNVSHFCASNPDWSELMARFTRSELDEATARKVGDVVVLANFFQELATALNHRSIDKAYTWDVFGFLVPYHWEMLKPFIDGIRVARGRPTLYSDFEVLVGKMKAVEAQRTK